MGILRGIFGPKTVSLGEQRFEVVEEEKPKKQMKTMKPKKKKANFSKFGAALGKGARGIGSFSVKAGKSLGKAAIVVSKESVSLGEAVAKRQAQRGLVASPFASSPFFAQPAKKRKKRKTTKKRKKRQSTRTIIIKV